MVLRIITLVEGLFLSELKGILKRNINHCNDDELGDRLSEILNEYCPTGYVWHYEGNQLMIEISLDEQDTIIDFIEDLVDCSYINKYNEDDEILTLSFTVSTLIKKLKNTNNDGYFPVQMDRFVKYQDTNENHQRLKKQVHIVDNKKLMDDMFTRGYVDNGIIFTAASPSEWVNHEIVDEVLKLLNTNRSFRQMIDNCMEKSDKED